MSLILGKSLDRSYNLRVPFLSGHFNIGIYFNKKSPFLLFSAEHQDSKFEKSVSGIKLAMFKNLKSSKFVNTFMDLNNYRNPRLDIIDQFKELKEVYYGHVNLFLNETIILSKHTIDEKDIFDTLIIYGFELPAYFGEYIFILAERQNIIKNLQKKIVRSTGLQIATSNSLQMIDEFTRDSSFGKEGILFPVLNPDDTLEIT